MKNNQAQPPTIFQNQASKTSNIWAPRYKDHFPLLDQALRMSRMWDWEVRSEGFQGFLWKNQKEEEEDKRERENSDWGQTVHNPVFNTAIPSHGHQLNTCQKLAGSKNPLGRIGCPARAVGSREGVQKLLKNPTWHQVGTNEGAAVGLTFEGFSDSELSETKA